MPRRWHQKADDWQRLTTVFLLNTLQVPALARSLFSRSAFSLSVRGNGGDCEIKRGMSQTGTCHPVVFWSGHRKHSESFWRHFEGFRTDPNLQVTHKVSWSEHPSSVPNKQQIIHLTIFTSLKQLQIILITFYEKYSLEIFTAGLGSLRLADDSMWHTVTEMEMPNMKDKEGRNVHRHKHCIRDSSEPHAPQAVPVPHFKCERARGHVHTWISPAVGYVSSASGGGAGVPSTCGAIILWHTYPPLNDFSSSPASHLIKVERGELNAIERSCCFQLHSLSLWKWMAADEDSDVLSHHDRVSLNVSYDLFYRCCFWLKASVES